MFSADRVTPWSCFSGTVATDAGTNTPGRHGGNGSGGAGSDPRYSSGISHRSMIQQWGEPGWFLGTHPRCRERNVALTYAMTTARDCLCAACEGLVVESRVGCGPVQVLPGESFPAVLPPPKLRPRNCVPPRRWMPGRPRVQDPYRDNV